MKVHLHHFSKIKSQKESQNSRNQGFSYFFCMMIEGSGSGSIPLTSGSGSGRPKNMWIRIRVPQHWWKPRFGLASKWSGCATLRIRYLYFFFSSRGHIQLFRGVGFVVLWIGDILVRIRIRKPVPLTYGSGSESGPCFFVSGWKDANKK